MCDGEDPTGSGNVPIELVVVREESDFPVHRVRQRIGVLSGRQDQLLIPKVNPLAVALVLNVKFLRLSVARHLNNLEANDVTVAQLVFVERRKVAVNAVMDLY